MKIIHRTTLRELALTMFLCLVSFNFLLMMEKLLRLSRLLSSVGAGATDMAAIMLYMQPQLLTLTIPMSLLISVLLTYGRLNMDNELTVLRASGMSLRRISLPVFASGMVCFLVGLILSFFISPIGSLKMREAVAKTLTERAPLAIEEGVFNTDFKGIIIHIREKPSVRNLKGIFVFDGRNKKHPAVMFAKEGAISGGNNYNILFELKDGIIHLAKGPFSTTISFKTYSLFLPLALETPKKKLSELTPFELIAEAKAKQGEEKTRAALEIQRRITLPSASLLLMFLGPPLSLMAGKRGRLGGLTLGLLVFAVYYAMLLYGENLALTGKVPLVAGAWTPVVILGAVSFLAFKKAAAR